MSFKFFDTNIVLDSLYPKREFFSKFQKQFHDEFLLKRLCITSTVDIEIFKVSHREMEFLIQEIYNSIRPIDWDSLDADGRDEVIKKMKENLKKSIKSTDNLPFVLGALDLETKLILTLTKEEIIENICPNFPYLFNRNLKINVSNHFLITPIDGDNMDKSEKLKSTIKDINTQYNLFKPKQSKDFNILSELIMLLEYGARFSNNETLSLDLINFYSRDEPFIKNINNFTNKVKEKSNKNNNELLIEEALAKIIAKNPYLN